MKMFRACLLTLLWFSVCGIDTVQSAYDHGGSDTDSREFLSVYPEKAATKLDSCALCHTGGQYEKAPGKWIAMGSCQWCHYSYGYDAGGNIEETLNSYGKDYRDKGRDTQALMAIEALDSDGDSFSNREEIEALRYPGSHEDDPTKIPAPYQVFSREELQSYLHTQFMLMNTHKSGDYYAQYSGVPVAALLKQAGLLPSSTGITVFAPDGWSQYHPLEPDPDPLFYPVYGTYPASEYYYDQQADQALNSQGWCDYSAPANQGRTHGELIENDAGLKMILAITRDGEYLQPGVLNQDNKLDGEGPFRIVVPQNVPGPPDQSSKAEDASNPARWIWPFDENADHNAGFATRTATSIKVDPMPEGTTEIDMLERGWNLVDENKIMLFGAINPVPTIEERLSDLIRLLHTLDRSDFKRPQQKNALILKIEKLHRLITRGRYDHARRQLEVNLLNRVDGCIAADSPDRTDMIIDCNSQKKVYWSLNEILVLVKMLI